jgi:uncharacterized LabA/DUF88 family protein
MSNVQPRIAVLIDADNVSPTIVEGLLEEVARYGVASIRRVYGDWSSSSMSGWKKQLLDNAIEAVQQHPYTKGKNATDMKMVIDAMDILYGGHVDGFALVTSDSDFTPLASRIRQNGLTVYGFGEAKTPQSLVKACDRFLYFDILREAASESGEKTQKKSKAPLKQDAKLVSMIRTALDDAADDDGWATLGVLGQNLSNSNPNFDPRHFGHKKLSDLLKAIGLFEIKDEKSASGHRQLRIRDPKQAP